MVSKDTKTRKNKSKSPKAAATAYPEGSIEFGSDGDRWVVKETENGLKRWVPFYSTTLFGYKPLTAKILAAHINKPLKVYERQMRDVWPKSPTDFDVRYTFTASGDGELLKKRKTHSMYPHWLSKHNYVIKKNDLFLLNGVMKSKELVDTIRPQVAPLPGELSSTNLMNTEAFVKA
jgi:hypothetical protein